MFTIAHFAGYRGIMTTPLANNAKPIHPSQFPQFCSKNKIYKISRPDKRDTGCFHLYTTFFD